MSRTISILLIEHETDLRGHHARMLTNQGYHVTSTPDGRTGLDIFHNKPTDLIILDLQLPALEGLDLLDEITRKTRNIPVILLAEGAAMHNLITTMRMGAWDVIPPPFAMESLRQAVMTALDRTKLLSPVHCLEQTHNKPAKELLHLLEKNKRLVHANEQLQLQLIRAQKMESIALLTAGIAHNFNNILGTIMCSSELLLDTWPQESPLYDDVRQILKACQCGKDLVDRLLSHACGPSEPKAPLHLAHLITEMLPPIRSILPSCITLKTRFEARADMINGVADQIQQVIFNLITNAVHALRSSDRPFLAMQIVNEPIQSREPVSMEKQVVLTITDNGQGIPKKNISRVFTPLFTTKPKGEGTGMGLFIVAEIVKRHQASISLHSKEGHGTSFIVRFPVVSG